MEFNFDNGDGHQDDVNLEPKDDNQQRLDENGNIISDIDDENDDDDNNDKNNDKHDDDDNSNDNNNNNDNDNKEFELEEGQEIEINNNGTTETYKVDKDGNLVDKDGKIFKEAKDVKDFLKEFSEQEEEDKDSITIDNIKTAVGIDVTDDKGNAITYDNTPEGIKNYVTDVINHQRDEISQTAINSLFDKYPVVKEFLNYYVANGNSYEGFGQMPDRSSITIDVNNEAQQEHIIRTAWKEQKKTGDVDSYINWLKSAGTLADTAKAELEGLKQADKAKRDAIAEQAKQAEQQQLEEQKAYWEGIHEIIKTRKIAGYTIPESIIVTKDGKKIANTPEDFYRYLYEVDNEGHSRYVNDVLKLKPEDRLQDEVLRAYLMYTGGSYSDLVKMAVNEEKVKKIKLQAKNAEKRTMRITPKKSNNNHIDLGY